MLVWWPDFFLADPSICCAAICAQCGESVDADSDPMSPACVGAARLNSVASVDENGAHTSMVAEAKPWKGTASKSSQTSNVFINVFTA